MQSKTKLVDAPRQPKRQKPQMEVPFYTPEELMKELMGRVYHDEKEAIEGIVGEYSDEVWNSIEGWDEE